VNNGLNSHNENLRSKKSLHSIIQEVEEINHQAVTQVTNDYEAYK